jgi:REP element-mobilizing transposase RayT
MYLSSDRSVRKLAAAMRSFHLTFAAVNRHVLFPTERSRRDAVRALGRVAGAWITLFALVDDHVHVVVLCEGSLRRAQRAERGGWRRILAALAADEAPTRERCMRKWVQTRQKSPHYTQ